MIIHDHDHDHDHDDDDDDDDVLLFFNFVNIINRKIHGCLEIPD
jgi:hypothetical protein